MVGLRTYDPALSMVDRTKDLTKYDDKLPNNVISLLIVVTYSVVVLNYISKTQLNIGEPATGAVAMGGRAIWSEPPVLMVSDKARSILKCTGWLQYLNKL